MSAAAQEAATPVHTNGAPAGDSSGAYITQESGPPIPEGEQAAFDKALELWDAADAGAADAAEPAAAPPPELAPDPDAAAPKPDATAAPADPDKLFETKFAEYRRQYAKLDAERQGYKAELAEYHKLKADLAEARYNPNKLLEIGGVPQEEFTKLLLNSGGEMSPEMRVALEAKQRAEASEKQLATFQQTMHQRQEQQLVDEYRNEAAAFIANSGDEHELTRTLGTDAATQLLMSEINGHYASNLDPATGTGPVLSYKEAADRIEKRIEADMFDRYANTKKLQARMREVLQPQQRPRTPGRTLTGNMTGHVAPGRTLTEDERLAAAVKQLTAAWQ